MPRRRVYHDRQRRTRAAEGVEVPDAGATFPIFDADNHYYEALDCCTRHIDPRLREKAVHFVKRDDQDLIFVGERLYTYGAVHVDHCHSPGSLIKFLHSLKSGVRRIMGTI